MWREINIFPLGLHLNENYYKFAPANTLTYGVIGNTAVFGSVIQGSSPCRSTKAIRASYIIRGSFFMTLWVTQLPSLHILTTNST